MPSFNRFPLKFMLYVVTLSASFANLSQAGTVYSDRNAFLAALNGSFTTDTWGTANSSSATQIYSAGSLSVTASATQGTLFYVSNGVDTSGNALKGGNALSFASAGVPFGSNTLVFDSFAGGVNAFGGYFWTGSGGAVAAGVASIDFIGSDSLLSQTVSSASGGPVAFLGYISNSSISSVVISRTSGSIFVNADQVTVGQTAPTAGVPEIDPNSAIAALSLLGTAVAMISGRRRNSTITA
jgi:hypothetical protein